MINKKLSFILPLPVYSRDIFISFGETNKEVLDQLSRFGISDKDCELAIIVPESSTTGRFALFENGNSIIRLINYPSTPEGYGTLAHEIFHAVTFIMDDIGGSFALGSSDESYAYLVGYVTKIIYGMLEEFNKKPVRKNAVKRKPIKK